MLLLLTFCPTKENVLIDFERYPLDKTSVTFIKDANRCY